MIDYVVVKPPWKASFCNTGSNAVKLPSAAPDTHCVVPKHCQHILICARRFEDQACLLNLAATF